MTGYLTGHMYGNWINATYLDLITGGWLELSEETTHRIEIATPITDRPSWV